MKIFVSLLFLCCFNAMLHAQQASGIVKGSVKDLDGKPLEGVMVDATSAEDLSDSQFVMTDTNGNFSISGLNSGVEYNLTFDKPNFEPYYIDGFDVNEGENNSIMVRMNPITELEGVVVTALGIKREEKKLGYAQQTINAEELSTAESNNWSSGLKGKVAGLNIVSSGSGPINSQVIKLRGSNSLKLANQGALIVIDGVPMTTEMTSSGNETAYMGNDSPIDFGNSIADINQDDIETVTVLKGAAAAALYGSRAGNGVVIITTKSGKKNQKIGIEFKSSTMIDVVNRWPDYQYEYGQGTGNYFDDEGNPYYSYGASEDGPGTSGTSSAFGPKFDGQYFFQYDPTLQGQSSERQLWRGYDDNRKSFWRTGTTFRNEVSISGGDEKGNYRASIGNIQNEWIMPNTGFNSYATSLNANYQISKWIKVSSVVNYTMKKSDNLPGTGYNNGSIAYFMIFQNPNVDLNWYKPRWYAGEEGYSQIQPFSSYIDNPYVIAYEAVNPMRNNRIMGNMKFDFNLSSKFNLMVRAAINNYTQKTEQKRPFDLNRSPNGYYKRQDINKYETNLDFLLSYKDKWGEDFTFDGHIGGNSMDYKYNLLEASVDALVVPYVYMLSNGVNTPLANTRDRNKKINSFYGMFSFAFRNQIFLDLTGRNDWSSTLPSHHNSYFYPSVVSSFILDDIFKMGSSIDMLKYRLSFAQVGSDTDPYQTSKYYSNSDFASSASMDNYLYNGNLKPEISTNWETGFELRMFKNRFGLDLTVYQTDTRNQIIPIPVDITSGYSYYYTNAGEVRNRGLEILLTGTPIRTNDFKWEISGTWSKNESEVLSLPAEAGEEQVIATAGTVSMIAKVGGSVTALYGYGFVRDPEGNIVYKDGIPAYPEDIELIGDASPDWRAGLTNTFTYKNLRFSFNFDAQYGGIVYSQSYHKMMEQGKLKGTLMGREDGFIIGEGVVLNEDGSYSPNTEQTTIANYYAKYYRRANVESNSFDASYIKLREVSLSYDVPKRLYAKSGLQGLSFTVFGRDLLTISDFPLYDPETAALNGAVQVPGVEMGQMPSTASYGFSINVKL
ncbi:SusC/RagA family TonB-linked outer membrane protein [Moheibacter sp. BDHS18]|uniref:SusC/RagA family TonB-linked outer membrane protein n=2 Tax=Moheibacter lacus TaxID=2745851 RepID=A0A838ZMY6_9FLAO|nr:SusC/RagA family TonB-linked outer membrane protein [Moheibacter lacus]